MQYKIRKNNANQSFDLHNKDDQRQAIMYEYLRNMQMKEWVMHITQKNE